jgi:ketosteroid isomerase-like protein
VGQREVDVVRDGKVARVEEYFDRREALRAAGLPED